MIKDIILCILLYAWIGLGAWWIIDFIIYAATPYGEKRPYVSPIIYGVLWPLLPITIPFTIKYDTKKR